jgi:hypothetical protein
MSNPKLHSNPLFAGGPLILTFAKVPAAKGGRMLESDHQSAIFLKSWTPVPAFPVFLIILTMRANTGDFDDRHFWRKAG